MTLVHSSQGWPELVEKAIMHSVNVEASKNHIKIFPYNLNKVKIRIRIRTRNNYRKVLKCCLKDPDLEHAFACSHRKNQEGSELRVEIKYTINQ